MFNFYDSMPAALSVILTAGDWTSGGHITKETMHVLQHPPSMPSISIKQKWETTLTMRKMWCHCERNSHETMRSKVAEVCSFKGRCCMYRMTCASIYNCRREARVFMWVQTEWVENFRGGAAACKANSKTWMNATRVVCDTLVGGLIFIRMFWKHYSLPASTFSYKRTHYESPLFHQWLQIIIHDFIFWLTLLLATWREVRVHPCTQNSFPRYESYRSEDDIVMFAWQLGCNFVLSSVSKWTKIKQT